MILLNVFDSVIVNLLPLLPEYAVSSCPYTFNQRLDCFIRPNPDSGALVVFLNEYQSFGR